MSRARSGFHLAVAMGAVAASYVAMRSPQIERVERSLAVEVRRPRGDVVDAVVSAATDLGSLYAAGGLAGILLSTGRRRAARDVLASASIAWIVAQALKKAVDRPRPYEADDAFMLVSRPAGSSWPSGHPAVTAAVATALAPSLPRRGRFVGASLAGFVALSRIYVGVHYLTDVVAGLGLGGIAGATWRLLTRFAGREEPESREA